MFLNQIKPYLNTVVVPFPTFSFPFLGTKAKQSFLLLSEKNVDFPSHWFKTPSQPFKHHNIKLLHNSKIFHLTEIGNRSELRQGSSDLNQYKYDSSCRYSYIYFII